MLVATLVVSGCDESPRSAKGGGQQAGSANVSMPIPSETNGYVAVAGRADIWAPFFSTNRTAITNGWKVLDAVLSGDSMSKNNIRAMYGSQVVFAGDGPRPEGRADLVLLSNVVLEVEISPGQLGKQNCFSWSAEVLGTLKSVDFDKRVIRIVAKPEDWRLTAGL